MKLSIDHIALSRAGRRIIDDISFDLSEGEAMVVTGENGTGKSTLLRSLAGLLPLEEGSITLTDETGKAFEGETREYCHYLGHQNGMKATLTVRENLEFWQNYCGHPELTVDEALDEVDLSHAIDLPYNYLSAGQKRRAAIARFLVSDRPIWIMDEPTSGLDAASVEIFSSICKAYCEGGGILIAATHLPLGLKKPRTLKLGGQVK